MTSMVVSCIWERPTKRVHLSISLSIEPTYILARSYMAQGMLAEGDYSGALTQLKLIEDQGGRDSWAYVSLDRAMRGAPTSY